LARWVLKRLTAPALIGGGVPHTGDEVATETLEDAVLAGTTCTADGVLQRCTAPAGVARRVPTIIDTLQTSIGITAPKAATTGAASSADLEGEFAAAAACIGGVDAPVTLTDHSVESVTHVDPTATGATGTARLGFEFGTRPTPLGPCHVCLTPVLRIFVTVPKALITVEDTQSLDTPTRAVFTGTDKATGTTVFRIVLKITPLTRSAFPHLADLVFAAGRRCRPLETPITVRVSTGLQKTLIGALGIPLGAVGLFAITAHHFADGEYPGIRCIDAVDEHKDPLPSIEEQFYAGVCPIGDGAGHLCAAFATRRPNVEGDGALGAIGVEAPATFFGRGKLEGRLGAITAAGTIGAALALVLPFETPGLPNQGRVTGVHTRNAEIRGWRACVPAAVSCRIKIGPGIRARIIGP